mmetsp:Transcript_31296/g.99854  ORF Transcript_31296/g.99854 Transcript_31296/m.99854 type:complete len:455 (-) Transcript_31296:1939-3303(-)
MRRRSLLGRELVGLLHERLVHVGVPVAGSGVERGVAVGICLIQVHTGHQERLNEAVVAGGSSRAQQCAGAALLDGQDLVGRHALDRIRLVERKGDIIEAARLAIGRRAVGLNVRLLPQVAPFVLQHQHLFTHRHPVLTEGGDDTPDQLRAQFRGRRASSCGIDDLHQVAERGGPRLRCPELEQPGDQPHVSHLLLRRRSTQRGIHGGANLLLARGSRQNLLRAPDGLGAPLRRADGEERLGTLCVWPVDGARIGVIKQLLEELSRLRQLDRARAFPDIIRKHELGLLRKHRRQQRLRHRDECLLRQPLPADSTDASMCFDLGHHALLALHRSRNPWRALPTPIRPERPKARAGRAGRAALLLCHPAHRLPEQLDGGRVLARPRRHKRRIPHADRQRLESLFGASVHFHCHLGPELLVRKHRKRLVLLGQRDLSGRSEVGCFVEKGWVTRRLRAA